LLPRPDGVPLRHWLGGNRAGLALPKCGPVGVLVRQVAVTLETATPRACDQTHAVASVVTVCATLRLVTAANTSVAYAGGEHVVRSFLP